MLPLVGKRFVDPGDSTVETAIGKVLGVLRPMWELAQHERAADAATATSTRPRTSCRPPRGRRRRTTATRMCKAMCMAPTPFSDAQSDRPHPGGPERAGGIRAVQLTGTCTSATATTSFPTRRIRPAISPACRGCSRTRRIRPRKRRRHELHAGQQLPRGHRRRRDPDARRRQGLCSTRARPARRCCRRCSPTRCRRNRATRSTASPVRAAP